MKIKAFIFIILLLIQFSVIEKTYSQCVFGANLTVNGDFESSPNSNSCTINTGFLTTTAGSTTGQSDKCITCLGPQAAAQIPIGSQLYTSPGLVYIGAVIARFGGSPGVFTLATGATVTLSNQAFCIIPGMATYPNGSTSSTGGDPNVVAPLQYYTGTASNPGQYQITSAAATFRLSNTPGVISGKYMLAVDGITGSSNNIWCQTVPVTSGGVYAFGAWFVNSLPAGSNQEIPTIQMTIDYGAGPIVIGATSIDLPEGGAWGSQSCLTTATSSSAIVCLRLLSGGSGGNDLCVDNITMNPVTGCVPGATPCTFTTVSLPIQLLYFNVKEYNNSIQLEWETAMEKDNDYFEVLKSADLKSWQILSKIPSSNHSFGSYYSYNDNTNDESGTYYYKLRQVDIDGTDSYSAIKSVKRDFNMLSIQSLINSGEPIKLSSRVNDKISVSIYDMTGRAISFNEIESKSEIEISTARFSVGTYIVKCISGDNIYIQKIIVR
jgi:hypothetical protein